MHYLKMYHWPKLQTNLGTTWDGGGGWGVAPKNYPKAA